MAPSNDRAVDYVLHMVLTISLIYFATYQSVLIGNEF
jgi:hypothetical protein